MADQKVLIREEREEREAVPERRSRPPQFETGHE
jgi:hypothetical protein